MSILDDAIREHLELKRAHGADDEELKRLEDEAFGPPQRPDEADPFAEAPTEFLLSPSESAADLPEIGDEAARGGRRPNITDLQEPPPVPPEVAEPPAPESAAPMAPPAPEDELSPPPDAPPPSPADAADLPLPPPADEPTAAEHEIVADPRPTAEERHAIADQPTQMFDMQAEMDAQAEADLPEVSAEQASPTDEELVDAVQAEPQAAPPAPPTETDEQPPLDTRGPDAEVAGHPPTEEESAEFDFFNEQRLSEELDQALEAPLPPTDEHGLPTYEDAPPAQGGIFDFESAGETYEDDPSEGALRRMPPAEPPSEETPAASFEPPSEETPRGSAEPPSEEAGYAFDPDTGHEDVLEDTPTFLEDAPEDDDLWFEQKPPKDFDLD
jgi:hypothetical protein